MEILLPIIFALLAIGASGLLVRKQQLHWKKLEELEQERWNGLNVLSEEVANLTGTPCEERTLPIIECRIKSIHNTYRVVNCSAYTSSLQSSHKRGYKREKRKNKKYPSDD